MTYFVLGVWVIQAVVGAWLLVGWARHGRHYAPAIVSHVVLTVAVLILWIVFMASGSVIYAWAALVVLTIGIPPGESMMVRRSRRLRGITEPGAADYGRAIVDVVRGRMPRHVTFHALFAGVVYFSCLGVCIGTTIAA
ncbi:hypothetical protein [Microbacterium sp.]|jgi:hypothetical protein|uniref:hypothetical protein n=1 Tax=Microbacterium sp. TaxID=51671 RepID=UPI0037CBBA81